MSNKLLESTLAPEAAVFRETVPAGEYWIKKISKGQTLRIVDMEGNQAVDTIFFDAHDTAEHYDAQATIRLQRNVYLTTGSRLYSVSGLHLATIVADICGRHDTLGGACAAESNSVRYPLTCRHMHNCRDSFLKAVLDNDFDLTKRDLAANINFFMNVPINPDGGSAFSDGISAPGKYVELKAERDIICLVSNCPQLNNPCNAYNPTPAQMIIWD